MADDILTTRREQALDRRSFLRGSSLFAAALGLGLASPLAALAQEQPKAKKDGKKDQKKDGEKDAKKDDKKDDKKEEKKEEEKKADPFGEEDGTPQTLVDEEGREYRTCPQCGANMYRQGRTWTCENCGYSYVE